MTPSGMVEKSETRSRVEAVHKEAQALSKKYNKPLMNSETGCVCRSNPYDIALEMCDKYRAGMRNPL